MTWFRRVEETPSRVEVTIHGLDALAAAVHELAQARRYEAELRAGIVKEKPAPASPKDPAEHAFKIWLSERNASSIEKGDLQGLYECLTGRREASAEVRARARKVLHAMAAPLPDGL